MMTSVFIQTSTQLSRDHLENYSQQADHFFGGFEAIFGIWDKSIID